MRSNVDIKQGEKASIRADDLCLAAAKMLKKAKAFIGPRTYVREAPSM